MSDQNYDQQASPVILVCLKVQPADYNINNQSIFQVFSTYGQIKKILIFERGLKLTKIFVEYSSLNEAQVAQKYLNNTKLFESVHCNIYFSHLKQLNLQKVPRTRGIDFSGEMMSFPNKYYNPQYYQHYQVPREEDEYHNLWSRTTSNGDLEDHDESESVDDTIPNEKKQEILRKLETVEANYQDAIRKLSQPELVVRIENVPKNLSLQKLANAFCSLGQIKSIGRLNEFVYVEFKDQKGVNALFQVNDSDLKFLRCSQIPGQSEKLILDSQFFNNTDLISRTLVIDQNDFNATQQIIKNIKVKNIVQEQNCVKLVFEDTATALFQGVANLTTLMKKSISFA